MLKLKIKDHDEVFFVSDYHFYHEKLSIVRGFDCVNDMNECLINSHNNTVSDKGIVFILGDFAIFKKTSRQAQVDCISEIFNKMNGKKYFIRGNHDCDNIFKRSGIEMHDNAIITINDQTVFLSHYAHLVWPKSHHGSWHLHGHSHGNLEYPYKNDKVLDVSIDNICNYTNFGPISFNSVKHIMSERVFIKKDHHEEE